MPETTDSALAMSEEQQQMMFDMTRALSNGGTVPPDLVDRLNGAGFRIRSEKFRAAQIVANHNVPAIREADAASAFCKANGYDEIQFTPSLLHPILLKLSSYDDGFGGTVYTWAIDGPYRGKGI